MMRSWKRSRIGGARQFVGLLGCLALSLLLSSAHATPDTSQANQSPSAFDQRRERSYRHTIFMKHFTVIQVLSQEVVRDHRNRVLSPASLKKSMKRINVSARALREMMAVGDLAREERLEEEFVTPSDYDLAISNLAKRVYDFAHNPTHQNSRIFDTIEATRAQTDLLVVITLSKAIESHAKGYKTTRKSEATDDGWYQGLSGESSRENYGRRIGAI